VDPLLVWQAVVNPLHLRAVLGSPGEDSTAEQLLTLVLDGATANLKQMGESR
jgi:hypothetical protein